jgi:hypothetical protein
MGEDFPVPMSIGSDLEMTLIDGAARDFTEAPLDAAKRDVTLYEKAMTR